MSILKKVIIASVALVLVLSLIFIGLGLFLPDEIVVENQIDINASPEEIWQVIEEREKFPEWAPNIEKVVVINENQWKEFPRGSDLPIIFENVKLEKPSRYELKYEMENIMNGEWIGTFEKTSYGTILKTKDKLIHKTWMGKIFMPLFFDIDIFAKEFNQKLKEKVESKK